MTHPIVMLRATPPRFTPSGRGVCFSIALFALGCLSGAAQCSQASRPFVAPADSAAVAPGASAQPTPPGSSSSAPDAPPAVRFAPGTAVTVLEDTTLQVLNDMPISSRTTRAGAKIAFTVTRDVVVDGILVIPCGATAYGTLVAVRQAGRLTGSSNLTLKLTTLNLDGRSYPLYSPPFKVVSQSKTPSTVRKVSAGAAVGAFAMDVSAPGPTFQNVCAAECTAQKVPANHVVADSVGAGLGAGVGAAIAAGSPPSIALIPAESQLEFTLASPIAVFPPDQATAAHLAQGMHRGGPVLYVRGENQ